jgi:hypothetical protein
LFYEDLSPWYVSSSLAEGEKLKAVGWLAWGHPYERRIVVIAMLAGAMAVVVIVIIMLVVMVLLLLVVAMAVMSMVLFVILIIIICPSPTCAAASFSEPCLPGSWSPCSASFQNPGFLRYG